MGSNAARAAAAAGVNGRLLPQKAGGDVAFVQTRNRPRSELAVTAPRMSLPIVRCDQRGAMFAPNRISSPLGSSIGDPQHVVAHAPAVARDLDAVAYGH